jgi:alkyldihydroxyacetonephosphate synthase
MRRWNGWGNADIQINLPPKGLYLLKEFLGEGQIQPDYPLEKFLQRIPDSRLPQHPLISFDSKLRLDHAHGQSLPDWIRLRGGTVERFPDGVAQPATIEEVQEMLQFAADNDIIVIPFGGGTSVVGHLEVPAAQRPVLSLSLQRVNRLIDLEPENLLATFEAGVRGPDLEEQLNSEGFTLGHYPQSFEFSSLGGWVLTRSSGQQSKYYGRIEQLFAGGEILTPQGALQLPPFPASAAGPDLRQLLLGSEGRIGVLTKVIVRISPLPEKDDIHAVLFPSWDEAKEGVQELAHSCMPLSMVRLSNPKETTINLAFAGHERQLRLLGQYLRLRGIQPKQACMCLIGFIGSRHMVRSVRREALSILRRHESVSVGKPIGKVWKKNRFRSAYLRNTLWDLGYAVDTLETAVTWDKVNSTMAVIEKSIESCMAQWNESVYVFSHLSHVYRSGSSIYTTYVFRLAETPAETFNRWKTLKQAASQAVVSCGGTISHQHGVGVDHKQYLKAEKGSLGISTLQQIFSHLDPDQRMNPNKLLP